MPITVIEGEQRGDEGKGRFVDMLMPEYEIGARFNGGDNAGHTVVVDDEVYKLHGLPTSIVHPGKKSVIGNGTVINPMRLTKEMDTLRSQDITIDPCNLLISSAAHLILPHYISEDEIREAGAGRQGSTKSGIAQAYAAKHMRIGLRAECIKNDPDGLYKVVFKGLKAQRRIRERLELDPIDELRCAEEFMERSRLLGEYVTDTTLFLNKELRAGTNVLAEGAQAYLLDIDHGMYPFTTSSSTTAGGVSTGLGVPGRYIDRVVGVSKAVQSHVGDGPFVTEISDPALLKKLHGDMSKVDAEKGTTTGRVRRLGHLDLAQIKRSQMINGTDEMALTKLDWISEERYGSEVPVCVAYRRKGKTLDMAPDAGYKLQQSRPLYAHLPTWSENIQNIRKFEDLPKNAQTYVDFIAEITEVPVTMIGVGPGRDQVIIR